MGGVINNRKEEIIVVCVCVGGVNNGWSVGIGLRVIAKNRTKRAFTFCKSDKVEHICIEMYRKNDLLYIQFAP